MSRPDRPARHRSCASRPLDWVRSVKAKLGILVVGAVLTASGFTWLGSQRNLTAEWTLLLATVGALVVTQLLAHGMTSPLREMTAAATAMATGDYSRRVSATSHDEVGQLARAFNTMAEDLSFVEGQRGEMIANVSHELRTPIAALQAQLENMVDGVTVPDREALGVALAQTERLARLVTYFLDLSRVEAGRDDLAIAEVDVKAFLREAIRGAELVASASGKAIRFDVDVRPDDLTVPADAERLHQVAANLLTNAVRHSPADAIVTARAYPRGAWVILEVADRGPGIPLIDRHKIFGRFERGNTPAVTGSASTGGTGLGLAIARWAVSLHSGQIEVADLTGPGCTMRVRLPRIRPVGPVTKTSNPPSGGPRGDGLRPAVRPGL